VRRYWKVTITAASVVVALLIGLAEAVDPINIHGF
jgi:high-affinity nickel permease